MKKQPLRLVLEKPREEQQCADRSVFVEPRPLHSTLRFRGLHKGVPDKPASQILSHQQGDSSVITDYIGIIPVLEGIEGVYEAILGPSRGIAGSDGVQNAH